MNHNDLLQAAEGLLRETGKLKKDVRRDFSLMNAEAQLSKVIHGIKKEAEEAPKEAREQLAYRVLTTLYDLTESFDEEYLGTELTYLAMAILAPEDSKDRVVQWEPDEFRYDAVIRLFSDNFPPEDPVWNHIRIENLT